MLATDIVYMLLATQGDQGPAGIAGHPGEAGSRVCSTAFAIVCVFEVTICSFGCYSS